MLTDERLYERYYMGDMKAAEELVERYGDPLIRYISGYISDYHESEDLMIEAFAQPRNDPSVWDGVLRHICIRRRGIFRFGTARRSVFHY